MEDKRIGIYQMLAEMLENQEMSQEEERKVRKLFEERENRRAEIRIAYDLLDLLQKEADALKVNAGDNHHFFVFSGYGLVAENMLLD